MNFPLACPKCAKDAGVPYRAATQPHGGAVVIALRCRECSHEWECALPSRPPGAITSEPM